MADKEPMPPQMRAQVESDKAALRKRRFAPIIEDGPDGWRSPFADDDEWFAMLAAAFATRTTQVVEAFFDQLQNLCHVGVYDEKAQAWKIDASTFGQLLAIVDSLRPQNEAQAAYAAQLCALHLSAMKLGARIRDYPDTRTVAILNKTVRAYGDGLETMQRVQGKVRKSRQSIKVERRVYYQQVNINGTGGGASETGGQPDAKPTAGFIEARAEVPSEAQAGRVVPFSRDPRQARLSDARRKRGSAEG